MTSKEALENIFMEDGTILYYDDDGNPQYLDTIDEYKAIKQDLEKLEQYEVIFNEPLRELANELEILKILKNHYRFNQNINEDLLVLKKPVLNEDAEKIKQWLEDDNNG